LGLLAGARLRLGRAAGGDSMGSEGPNVITLFLCGDVMTGRGIDQVLPHPSPPRLYEPYVKSALTYVEMAEQANDPIPRPVDFPYVWGDALAELERMRPDVRIINLETSLTRSEEAEPKGINYRMSPENVGCITAAGIDCCVLANNHVLDWGSSGLSETLQTLRNAGVKTAGAGSDFRQAEAPAVLEVPSKGRVVVFSFGETSSGIPRAWAAAADRPGVNLLRDLSGRTVAHIAEQVTAAKRPGDVVVASLHWGGNWGYGIAREQRNFAHGLIDEAGVDIVHGHSSHHPKGIEVHEGKLILYGCGDFIDDYEGIGGYEEYRDDLVLMYFPAIEPESGNLVELRMTPLQIRNFRLNHPSLSDRQWLRRVLERESQEFGVHVEEADDGRFRLRWRDQG
jgi:poly-gamma-glutamate synthesis protein (capsule biosynthesis protein)